MKIRLKQIFFSFCLILTSTLVFADKADELKLSLKYSKTETKIILNEISERTGYNFMYKNSDINDKKKISVNVSNASLRKIIRLIANLHQATFQFTEDEIILKKIVASKKNISITGTIKDENGETLPGVNVVIKNTVVGTVSDIDGHFELKAGAEHMGKDFSVSTMGYKELLFTIDGSKKYDIQMEQESVEVDEVVVVAFGKQKKESVVSSITTINTAELKVPSSNLTTALAGRMSGMISYQRSGEPGEDNAQFFVRGITSFGAESKKDPLILIDGVEMGSGDLSRLNPDDIAAFSILKDATAAALYGARGANGVILVTTKQGKEGAAVFNIRVENSISMPTRTIKMADPITYMNLHNEALDTRDYENRDRFTYLEIERRKDPNKNDLVYPTIDWTDMLTKNYTTNQRINANVSGGGKKIKYYVAGSLTQDNGILKVDNNSNFNSNIDLKKFLLRTNVNIDLTSTAKLNIRMHGTFDDYTGPMTGGSEVYVNTLKTSPVLFPATFERDVRHQYVDHTLFGNYYSNGKLMQNPYANMVKGYKEYQRTTFLTQLEYEQDLNFITEGLHFKMLANTSRYSFFNATRQYKPFYYQVATYNKSADTYNLMAINDGESNNGVTKGDESLEYADNGGDKDITSSYYLENSLRYNRTFLEKHSVGATLVAIFREFQVSNPKGDNGADRLQASLPSRNLGVSGRVEYSYDGTYFGEFNFGYNGSERFDGQNRYGFFPAFGGGIVISNYDFWKPIKKSVNLLKLKTTYGLVGNDQIGSANDRFFYLSSVSVANSGSFKFGRNRAESMPLTKVNRYANPKITWEIAYKANYGIELGLFDKFTLQADFFTERRTNILMSRADIPLSMGLEVIPQANVGEAKSFGFDASVDYKQFFSNDFWITARGNFTFARNEITKIEEPDYNAIGAPWKSRVGYSASQKWGYVAERLFVNDAEAENSAPQHVGNGDYGGGDIKYKDINKDGKIDEFDQVPIGHPTTPEIIYGFGASLGYKDFDFSFFFQGSALSSFRIDYNKMNPFVENKGWMTGLTEFIADDYYSEEFPNTSAEWPRLSPYNVSNNSANSTFFLRDGAFIRLKSVELGYNIPESLSKQIAIKNARFYLSGSNLLTWSKFDLWDVEMGGDGLGYPIQRVFNLGLQVTF